jgi:hypothetical protein
MILPVGLGWQEGIPSPNFNLIVASGHSPLSFAFGRSSPQLFNRDQVPMAFDGWWSYNTAIVDRARNSHGLDSWQSRSVASSNGHKALGLDGHPIMQHWQIHGSDKLTRSARDNKSQAIFFVGLGVSL